MSSAASPSLEPSSAVLLTRLIPVADSSLSAVAGRSSDPSHLCNELESGNILYFPRTPFFFPPEEREFLLSLEQSDAAFHKNISYRPAEDRVRGVAKADPARMGVLRNVLRNYSSRAARFLDDLLVPYRGNTRLDLASFRPLEESGRSARLHARNDLPHVDAFPTRPTNGDRILRLFTNIHPSRNRVWATSLTFEGLAPQFVPLIGLPQRHRPGFLARSWRSITAAMHLPGARRSPYDQFMHRCHNAMKESQTFQDTCPRQRWEFPPNSTWMVMTDFVSHAVLEGQYALEQTFLISHQAMLQPEKSPLAILERLAGHSLKQQ